MLDDVDTAVRLADQSYRGGDAATARVLIAAARSTLGKIDERFELPGMERSRALLRDADADLKAIEPSSSVPASMFRAWRDNWPARVRRLEAAEGKSLFSEAVLRRALGN
jgi:hypothetical protein